MKNTELKTAIADRLARISTQSTLNLLISKEGNETIFNLKNSLQADLHYYDTMPIIAETISTKEHKHEENTETIAFNNSIIKDIEKALETIEDKAQIKALYEHRNELIFDNNFRKAENLKINSELIDLYNKLNYTYSPAFDLYQIAYTAILEKIDTCNIDETTDTEKALETLKSVIVAKVPYKTKEGEKEYTLKQWADKAVRESINEKRNHRATKTLYITVGEDEEGNELYIQADALLTAGGISDIYAKAQFEETLAKLNLTDTELLIVRLLMQGKTTRQIADRLGIKAHTTIVRRIEKIRTKALELGLKPHTTTKK